MTQPHWTITADAVADQRRSVSLLTFSIDHSDRCDQARGSAHSTHPGNPLGLQHIQRASKSVGFWKSYPHHTLDPGTNFWNFLNFGSWHEKVPLSIFSRFLSTLRISERHRMSHHSPRSDNRSRSYIVISDPRENYSPYKQSPFWRGDCQKRKGIKPFRYL